MKTPEFRKPDIEKVDVLSEKNNERVVLKNIIEQETSKMLEEMVNVDVADSHIGNFEQVEGDEKKDDKERFFVKPQTKLSKAQIIRRLNWRVKRMLSEINKKDSADVLEQKILKIRKVMQKAYELKLAA